MKKVIFLIVSIIIVVFCISCTGKNNETGKILSIYDIQSDPLSFTGKITINGVAAAFSESDTTLFGVMDTAELMACKNLYCGAFTLPARYTGNNQLPELSDVIDMNGSFVETENGIYFAVTDFEVKRNIMRYLSN
jgi:hypothetical protein